MEYKGCKYCGRRELSRGWNVKPEGWYDREFCCETHYRKYTEETNTVYCANCNTKVVGNKWVLNFKYNGVGNKNTTYHCSKYCGQEFINSNNIEVIGDDGKTPTERKYYNDAKKTLNQIHRNYYVDYSYKPITIISKGYVKGVEEINKYYSNNVISKTEFLFLYYCLHHSTLLPSVFFSNTIPAHKDGWYVKPEFKDITRIYNYRVLNDRAKLIITTQTYRLINEIEDVIGTYKCTRNAKKFLNNKIEKIIFKYNPNLI